MKYITTKLPELKSVNSIEITHYDFIIIVLEIKDIERLINYEIKIDGIPTQIIEKFAQHIKADKSEDKTDKIIIFTDFIKDHKISLVFKIIKQNETKKPCDKEFLLWHIENCSGAKAFSSNIENALFICLIDSEKGYPKSKIMTSFALGFLQAAYNFNKYITDEKVKNNGSKLQSLTLFGKDINLLEQEIIDIKHILDSIYFVRDVVNEPANIIYPEYYAKITEAEFIGLENTKVKLLNKKELSEIGMNMLLGVSAGSDKEPYVVIIEYKGNDESQNNDLALVGKGVTFDSGGVSIKPSKGMEDMKGDMAGSAAVIGTMKLLALRKAKVNAIGIVGLVENMLNGSAQHPGDIVKSLSGKTVEILNTDAEGRLVLGDILYYAQKHYNPTYMIDIATLTGAIVVALGSYYAGMYSNSDELADMLRISSQKTGDYVWRMPLDERFSKMNESSIADLKNVTNTGQGGSITAATFLQEFIHDCKNWAHIDIVGVSNVSCESNLAKKRESTAFGVKLLNQFVIDNIEKKC